jgi:tetratricopeptide (TPR) repeat protein
MFAGKDAVHRYCRADVLRILHITAQQLVQWQKAGLVPAGDAFSFFDLLQIRKVRDLRAKHVRAAVIRESLEAMQKQVAGMENPLVEASAFSAGSRVVFRHAGRAVEPTSGQFVLDFDTKPQRVISSKVRPIAPPIDGAQEWFARGIALEEDPASQSEAILAYRKVLEINPQHAPAHINLGTIYYNSRDFKQAERHYRAAIEVDPRYALAYFDLGNVLDETGRLREAIEAYRTAITLAPTYADAHYNLALALDKMKESRKALRHWRTYAKLDQQGPWSTHARSQVKKIIASDSLRIVYRRP